MRYILPGFFLLLLFLCIGGGEKAYANGPVPRYCFDIAIENAPEGTTGLDFLVPKSSIPEEEYLEVNELMLEEANLPADCELVTYEEDGYVSFSMHDSEGQLRTDLEAKDGTIRVWEFRSGYDIVTDLGQETKIVLFDREGKILSVSDPFKAYASKPRHFYGEISYDAASKEVISNGLSGGLTAEGQAAEEEKDSTGVLFGLVIMVVLLLGVLIGTIVLEFLIGLVFRLKPIWWVIPVNLFTNLLFNILLVICCFLLGMNYYAYVVTGEIGVIVIEYFLYKSVYKDISSKKLMLYSIVANLFSAAVVLLVTGGAL